MKKLSLSQMLEEMLSLKGVTQQVLSDDLRIDQSTISRILQGKISDRSYLMGKDIEKHYKRLMVNEMWIERDV